MRIGLLLPSVYVSKTLGKNRIFAPRELVILLADGLVDRGHDVFLFAPENLVTKAKIISVNSKWQEGDKTAFASRFDPHDLKQAISIGKCQNLFESELTLKAYQMAQAGQLDVIHSFHDYMAHYFEELTGVKTLYTLHDPLLCEDIYAEYALFEKFQHHCYVSISHSQRQSPLKLNFVNNVYNGVDLNEFPFSNKSEGYLAFLGRLIPEKGGEYAIQASLQSAIPLKIAASKEPGCVDFRYYHDNIAPALEQHRELIQYAGYLTGEAKADFIGKAKALLMPIQWEEPFGMVMIEAMATGTPVIAFNRGSVSEVIEDGVTGFIVEPKESTKKSHWTIKQTGLAGLVEAISRLNEIDRTACRQRVEHHFSAAHMVKNYEDCYSQIVF